MKPRDGPTDRITVSVAELEEHARDDGLRDDGLGGQARGRRPLAGLQERVEALFGHGGDNRAIEKPAPIAERLDASHARENATGGITAWLRKGQGEAGLWFETALEHERDPLRGDSTD